MKSYYLCFRRSGLGFLLWIGFTLLNGSAYAQSNLRNSNPGRPIFTPNRPNFAPVANRPSVRAAPPQPPSVAKADLADTSGCLRELAALAGFASYLRDNPLGQKRLFNQRGGGLELQTQCLEGPGRGIAS